MDLPLYELVQPVGIFFFNSIHEFLGLGDLPSMVNWLVYYSADIGLYDDTS